MNDRFSSILVHYYTCVFFPTALLEPPAVRVVSPTEQNARFSSTLDGSVHTMRAPPNFSTAAKPTSPHHHE